ncbi:MAG: serine protease [Ferrovibrio sp.]|uniref:hypothetical protein n=1 Tax=Ferrovibrio sp. TaxID=1917215 RepID=UPI00262BFEBF|nr:hypothetical protein [Ferrovibrio sp.]MCW0232938.1 serine protease [Ferrovibrio sp.]
MTDLGGKKNQEDLLSRISEQSARCVVPIFRNVKNGKPEACGTGFLVSKDDDVFLITAGHVISDLEDNHDLFFYINNSTVRHLVGSYRKTLSFDRNHKNDRMDTGVLKLDGFNAVLNGTSMKSPLPFYLLLPAATPRAAKHYLVTGFPSSKSRYHFPSRSFVSKPYAFYCISTNSPYVELGLRENLHIALSFDEKDIHAGDFGSSVNPPSLKGMSGSPVWLLFDEVGSNPSETHVTGVFIEHWRDKRLLIAADICVAIDIIQKEFAAS